MEGGQKRQEKPYQNKERKYSPAGKGPEDARLQERPKIDDVLGGIDKLVKGDKLAENYKQHGGQ